jgi:Raf kinase inhibitor-like YbhB/YbcL family protein
MGPEMKKSAGSRVMRTAVMVATAFALALIGVLFWRHPLFISADDHGYAPLELKSASFSEGGDIPSHYTCEGADVSPNLEWSGAPADTKSFALILHDPDASQDFTHWVAYNIPAGVHELAEGASTDGAMPNGSAEGMNDFHKRGYGGPCPPPGKPHHYTFLVYALDTILDLPPGVNREQLQDEMQGHILAEGKLVGLYQRNN